MKGCAVFWDAGKHPYGADDVIYSGSQVQGTRETQAAEEKDSREQIIIPHKDQEQGNLGQYSQ